MTDEEKRKIWPIHPPEWNREGVDTLSEVSAFLGGIFFTGLLILVQQRDKFDSALLEFHISNLTIRITQLHLISIPLSVSIILFIFSSFFFAIACCKVTQEELDLLADEAFNPFVLGILSMFLSLFAVLILIDIVVALLGVILSVGALWWWGTRKKHL